MQQTLKYCSWIYNWWNHLYDSLHLSKFIFDVRYNQRRIWYVRFFIQNLPFFLTTLHLKFWENSDNCLFCDTFERLCSIKNIKIRKPWSTSTIMFQWAFIRPSRKKVGFSCSKDDGGISLSRKLGTPPPLTTRQITPNDEKNRSLPPFHHIIHHSRAPIPPCLPPSASPQYYAAPKCPLIPGSLLPPKKIRSSVIKPGKDLV